MQGREEGLCLVQSQRLQTLSLLFDLNVDVIKKEISGLTAVFAVRSEVVAEQLRPAAYPLRESTPCVDPPLLRPRRWVNPPTPEFGDGLNSQEHFHVQIDRNSEPPCQRSLIRLCHCLGSACQGFISSSRKWTECARGNTALEGAEGYL